MLEPIKRISLTDAVVHQLRTLILEGKLKCGDRIPSERELSADLAVSRTAVREAKRALITMGLLEAKPGEGTFVRDDVLDFLTEPLNWGIEIEREKVSELIEARRIVEIECAALAAERATAKDKETLRQIVEQMQTALESDDKDAFLEADLAFHGAIAEAARNAVLVRIILAIRGLLRVFIDAVLDVRGSAKSALEDHRQVAEAIFEGDAGRARKAMERHLEEVQRAIVEQTRREG